MSALIIGDAAIATGLYEHARRSCGKHHGHCVVFVTPEEPATLLLRLGVVLAAGLAGPVGLAGLFAFLLSLSGTACLQVPYLAAHPFPQRPMAEDGVIRRNHRTLAEAVLTFGKDGRKRNVQGQKKLFSALALECMDGSSGREP